MRHSWLWVAFLSAGGFWRSIVNVVDAVPETQGSTLKFSTNIKYCRSINLRKDKLFLIWRDRKTRISRRWQTLYFSDLGQLVGGKVQEFDGRSSSAFIRTVNSPVYERPISPALSGERGKDSGLISTG